jgi:hypothetical protein
VRRFMVLVMVLLLTTAMLVASAAPAFAGKVRFWTFDAGTPVPTVVCDVVTDDSGIIGWRNGQCWVFHPSAISF